MINNHSYDWDFLNDEKYLNTQMNGILIEEKQILNIVVDLGEVCKNQNKLFSMFFSKQTIETNDF